jgi:hypothetical protein
MDPKYGFIPWVLAFGFIAALQRVEQIRPVAQALMALLVLILLLSTSQKINLIDAARLQLGLTAVTK